MLKDNLMTENKQEKQGKVRKAIERYLELEDSQTLQKGGPSKEIYNLDEANKYFEKSFIASIIAKTTKLWSWVEEVYNKDFTFRGDCLMYSIIVYITKELEEPISNYFGSKEFTLHLEGAFLDHVDFTNCNISSSRFDDSALMCVIFNNTTLDGSFFKRSHLDKTKFVHSNLPFTDFDSATFLNPNHLMTPECCMVDCHLYYSVFQNVKARFFSFEKIQFNAVNFKNAHFGECEFLNVDFKGITTDENTVFNCVCEFNSKVNFEDVDFSCVKDSSLRTGLMYSTKRLRWERKLKKGYISDEEMQDSCMGFDKDIRNNDIKYNKRRRRKIKTCNIPVKTFWYCSDFGYSTKRIIYSFFGVSVFFASIYWLIGLIDWGLVKDDSCWGCVANLFQVGDIPFSPLGLHGILRTLYFSIVTMTTLGFGDVYGDPNSLMGYVLLSCQVIMGYVLLGILITRVSVLFMSQEIPEVPPLAEEHKKEDAQIKRILIFGALAIIAILGWAKLLYVYCFRI